MQGRSEYRSHRTRRSETHQEAALGAAPDSDLRPRHTALEEVLYRVELIYKCALQRRALSPRASTAKILGTLSGGYLAGTMRVAAHDDQAGLSDPEESAV